MRHLIVKYLALSYRVRLFGKEFTYVRAANVVVPILLLLGYALIRNENYPVADLLTCVFTSLFGVVFYAVAVYLRVHPVRWHELTTEQRWFYGHAVRLGKTNAVLTEQQYAQWQEIHATYQANTRRWHNVGVFLLNPLAVVFLTVLLMS